MTSSEALEAKIWELCEGITALELKRAVGSSRNAAGNEAMRDEPVGRWLVVGYIHIDKQSCSFGHDVSLEGLGSEDRLLRFRSKWDCLGLVVFGCIVCLS